MDTRTANDLIARSAHLTEVITAEWTAELAADLLSACKGNGYFSGCAEFWGRSDAGEWHVHLNGAP